MLSHRNREIEMPTHQTYVEDHGTPRHILDFHVRGLAKRFIQWNTVSIAGIDSLYYRVKSTGLGNAVMQI